MDMLGETLLGKYNTDVFVRTPHLCAFLVRSSCFLLDLLTVTFPHMAWPFVFTSSVRVQIQLPFQPYPYRTHTHTPCLNSTWHRFNMIHIDMTCWVHIHDGNYPFHHKMLHWFDCWGHFRTVNLLSCSRNHFEMSFVTWWVILLEVNRCTVVMKGLTWSVTILR